MPSSPTGRCAVQPIRHGSRTRTAQGSRWESTHGLCRQHPQVSSLSPARAVSMAWQRYREAPPGQRPAASARRRLCPATLARLEPESPPTRLYATRATPTHRGEPAVFCHRFTRQCGSDPFPRTTRALSSLMARAAGSQCARFNSWASDDQTVRGPRKLCHLARVGDGLAAS